VLDEGVTVMPASRDRQAFPAGYAEIGALEEQSTRNSTLAAGGGAPEGHPPGGLSVSWVVTGPLRYDRSALEHDIAKLKSALSGHPEASREGKTSWSAGSGGCCWPY
jgi:5-methyltetrahydropteroyltriglutamate--homocysteine methyltransferase